MVTGSKESMRRLNVLTRNFLRLNTVNLMKRLYESPDPCGTR